MVKLARVPSLSSSFWASCERLPADGSSPFSLGRLSLGELQPETGVLLLLGDESSVSGTLCLMVGGALSLRVSGLLRVFRCFFSLCFTFRFGSDAALRSGVPSEPSEGGCDGDETRGWEDALGSGPSFLYATEDAVRVLEFVLSNAACFCFLRITSWSFCFTRELATALC